MGVLGVDEKQNNVKKRNLPEEQKAVSREAWKALEPTGKMPPLEIPLHNVILTWTDTEPCELPEECEERVRSIQKTHMDSGLPDIQYNFLVGGDRNVYEGRGWKYEPPRYPEDKIENAYMFNSKCIEIAFIDKHMTNPHPGLITKVTNFLAAEMIKELLEKPVGMKGILNNKIVRFSELMEEHYKDHHFKL